MLWSPALPIGHGEGGKGGEINSRGGESGEQKA